MLVPEELGPQLALTNISIKILDPDPNISSHKILKANEAHHENIDQNQFIYSWNKDICKIDKLEDLPCFSPSELIGCTFLYEIENKKKLRAEVARN